MNNKEKINKATELIRSTHIRDEITRAEMIYEEMKYFTLYEIAEEISNMVNLIYDLRDILEAE